MERSQARTILLALSVVASESSRAEAIDVVLDLIAVEESDDGTAGDFADLADVLRQLRVRKGWSVNDAASAAGVAPMTWRRLESGQDVRDQSRRAVTDLLNGLAVEEGQESG